MPSYVSIDIETTGLNWENCQILEFAAIIADECTPIDQLPRMHCYLTHERVKGEHYALSMHAEILRRIATRQEGFNYLLPYLLGIELKGFLGKHGLDPMHAVAAGKNFAGFDKNFLLKLDSFHGHVNFKHRVIDPGNLYWEPAKDGVFLPDTKTCMERAGIPGQVAHTAMDDALTVVKLVRAWVAKQNKISTEIGDFRIEVADAGPHKAAEFARQISEQIRAELKRGATQLA